MKTITIEISEEEFKGLLQAYRKIQSFLEKFASPEELYRSEFLEGLEEALDDVKHERLEEVDSFEAFIQ